MHNKKQFYAINHQVAQIKAVLVCRSEGAISLKEQKYFISIRES